MIKQLRIIAVILIVIGFSSSYVGAQAALPALVTTSTGSAADGTQVNAGPVIASTTATIGGALLLLGCTTGSASVAGATSGMVAVASPAGAINPGLGVVYNAYVSAANTVTIQVCALAALTLSSTTYNVRVIP